MALSFQGSTTEAWLNLRPMDGRYLFSELGAEGEIRHHEAECMIEWVVIGKGSRPGESESPRRDRFEQGLVEIAAAIGTTRGLTLDGLGTAYLRLADQPLALAADRSVLASVPNVSACSVAPNRLMMERPMSKKIATPEAEIEIEEVGTLEAEIGVQEVSTPEAEIEVQEVDAFAAVKAEFALSGYKTVLIPIGTDENGAILEQRLATLPADNIPADAIDIGEP
eukprot:gene16839-23065_t